MKVPCLSTEGNHWNLDDKKLYQIIIMTMNIQQIAVNVQIEHVNTII